MSRTVFTACVFLTLAAGCLGQIVNTCPFFGTGRVAAPKANLGNCSWYEYSSCCERAEVTAVFAEMLSLQDASQACRNRVNFMMCYFCAPTQRTFMIGTLRQARICSSYCDDTYDMCKSAKHNGVVLSTAISSGRQFCENNFFEYATNNVNCLSFNASAFSSAPSIHMAQASLLPLVSFAGVLTLLSHYVF